MSINSDIKVLRRFIMDFTELFISFLITIIAYMAIPMILLLVNGKKFEQKKAKKIALWNSLILGFIFFVIASDNGIAWNAAPAMIYYWINSAILSQKD